MLIISYKTNMLMQHLIYNKTCITMHCNANKFLFKLLLKYYAEKYIFNMSSIVCRHPVSIIYFIS